MSSSCQQDSDYRIQQDEITKINELYSIYKSKFPKIKKDLGFSQLSKIDLREIPWSLYVMILTKSLNPASLPDWDCKDDKIVCNICAIYFIPDAKDRRRECAIRNVNALYNLHKSVDKSVDKLCEYKICSACYYALQNDQIMLDYPRFGRKFVYDDINTEYYIQSFILLKRSSPFGYHGKLDNFNNFNVLEYALECDALDQLDSYNYAG